MLATGAAIGAVLAFLLERVAWFQNLPPQAKVWLSLGICAVLPFAGWFGGMALGYASWPVGLAAWAEGVFHELEVGFLAWAGSQGWHLVEKAVRG